ncbi:hypothetical protein P3T76_007442 [Phytophthora citrophthora]|uniref:Uncharacterized protein n=1 Tax=Phytophthora citrophthora TaxID=4793 RepID=A0AAD9GNA0_9STRA|nr:hypothetical protein P3T76_007442 [Phytophthora citrophthora]
MADENDSVLSVLGPALHRLLRLTPTSSDGINPHRFHATRTTPVLKLQLFPRSDRRQMGDTERFEALSAFALLVTHSHLLCDYPEVKSTFWLDVLQSRMAYETTRHVPQAALSKPEFPHFAIDFSNHSVVPEDALVAFFTTPLIPTQVQVQPRSDENRPDVLAIELSFADCRLTSVEAIEAVERVLDRVFTHPTRQFAVSALDLSKNRMGPSELAVVARIAYKCRNLYGVSELRLDEIIPGVISTDYHCPDTTPQEFLDIMKAAYGVDGSSVLTAITMGNSTGVVKDAPIRASTLCRVSLEGNYVCPKYFASLYSALRYGSSVHEDFSQYIAKPRKGMPEKALCRSWQAFGLFYPRPKRFRKLLGLRNIGGLDCSKELVEAFTKALHNPATELAYCGVDPTGRNAAANELMMCTVKKGASVELVKIEKPKSAFFGFGAFGSVSQPPAPNEPEVRKIEVKCELEGVCVRESDGAVCVVIPSVGLGWVQRDAVECIEREPLDSAWKHQDGQYAVQLGCDYSNEGIEAMKVMLALIGDQIFSLSFDCYRLHLSIVPEILQYCPNLQHLSLQSINLPKSDADALLIALRTGPLRTQLLTLNLNDSSMLQDSTAQQLTALLATDSFNEDRLALRELRLHGVVLGIDTVTALNNSLLSNYALRFIQLTRCGRLRNQDLYVEQMRLSEIHDEQLLRLALPIEAKLALLSALSRELHPTLDVNLLTQIFQFADGRDVRRVIAWTADINCGSY